MNPISRRKTPLISAALSFLALIIAISGFSNTPAHAASPDPIANNTSVVDCPGSPAQCFADVVPNSTFFDFANYVFKYGIVSGYACGGAGEPCDASNRPYYRPNASVTRGQMSKFTNNARIQPGSYIISHDATNPLYFETTSGIGSALVAIASGTGSYAVTANASGSSGVAVSGSSSNTSGYGVAGSATGDQGRAVTGIGSGSNTVGVDGAAFGSIGSQIGVRGTSANGYGVAGFATANGYGVYGEGTNQAGYFQGNVTVTGNCCAMASGTTRIDNPLDPANKYLTQSLVQSPEMLSVLNGNITTDANGDALVTLPAYLTASNTDFRYQLTVLGQFAQAIVSREAANNTFAIKTDEPNVKVSWQITGVRSDPYALANPLQPEQSKSTEDQGKYLHPELYNQPITSRIGYNTTKDLLPPTLPATR